MTQPQPVASTPPEQPKMPTAQDKLNELFAANATLAEIEPQLMRLAVVIDTYIANSIAAADARDLIGPDSLQDFKQDVLDVRQFGSDFLTRIAEIVQKATGAKTTNLSERLAQELAEHAELLHKAEDGAALASFVALHLKLQLKLDGEAKPADAPKASLFNKLTQSLYEKQEPVEAEPTLPEGNWLTPPLYVNGKAYTELMRAKKAIGLFGAKGDAALADALKSMKLTLEDLTGHAEEVMKMARDQQTVSSQAQAKATKDTKAIADQMKAWAAASDYAVQVEKYLGLDVTPAPKKK